MSINRKRMKEINSIKEKDIDYSDIIEFFKEEGKRYQSKINNVMQSYVEVHQG